MPIFNMIAQGSGGGGGGNIGEPLNLTVTLNGVNATITWEDNEIGTIPPTTFQKSELVRKIGSAPTSPSDGDLVVTETVKDTYKTTGYVDQGLNGETYYYRVFSYSDLGGISYCDAVSVTPKILPSAYQEVEYIQSSGTQYIDSGISGANGYIVEAKFIFTDIGSFSDDCYVLGCGGAYPNYAAYITKQGAGTNNRWRQSIQNIETTGGSISIDTEYVVKSTILTSGNVLEVNGSTIGTSTLSTSYDNGYNMYILAMNSGGTAGNFSKAKLYYLKIWQGNESNLIRDYVPCYRKADDEIGLYDLVNDVFYTNSGTGDFTKGPNV